MHVKIVHNTAYLSTRVFKETESLQILQVGR